MIRTLLTGCVLVTCCLKSIAADESSATKPVVTKSEVSKTDSNKTEAAAEIKLVEGNWKTIQDLIKSSKGKIVVVDIWSTACLPCMREYPNLIKLQEKYGKKIVCASLNVDYVGIKTKPPEYYRPRVEKFLKRSKSTCRNYLCNIDGLELFDELDLSSIPAVYVYSADGKLAKRFDDRMLEDGEEDAFTYKKDINPLIEKLLTAKRLKN